MYFICQPIHGFIDICCEIAKCLKHCETFHRKIIIDTTKSSLEDDIYNYFEINHPLILTKKNYSLFYEKYINYDMMEPKNLTKEDLIHGKEYELNLDEKKSYKTKFIYRSFGAHNSFFIELMKVSKLNAQIKEKFLECYTKLPKSYIAIHVRHTDYQSNVDEFIQKLLESNPTLDANYPIFLATDNKIVLDIFRKTFTNIYSFVTTLPEKNDEMIGIHNLKKTNKFQFNMEIIIDFLLLIFGKEYYFSCLQSGFSQEVKNCRKNKKIICQFIGFDDDRMF